MKEIAVVELTELMLRQSTKALEEAIGLNNTEEEFAEAWPAAIKEAMIPVVLAATSLFNEGDKERMLMKNAVRSMAKKPHCLEAAARLVYESKLGAGAFGDVTPALAKWRVGAFCQN